MIILGFSPLLTAWKLEIKKKRKKHLDISPFYTSVPKLTIICYTVPCSWDMVRDRCNCYFSFWASFCLLTPPPPCPHPNSPKNENVKKIEKETGDIIILYTCTKNHDHMLYCSWEMAHDTCNRWMDRQTDGWTEKVIYRGGCPTWKSEKLETAINTCVLTHKTTLEKDGRKSTKTWFCHLNNSKYSKKSETVC